NGELHRAAAAAAVLRRKRQAEPAELRELGPELAAPARLAVRDLLECAVVVAPAEEFFGAVAQDHLLGIVSKVHGDGPGCQRAIPFKHRSRLRLSRRGPKTGASGGLATRCSPVHEWSCRRFVQRRKTT